MAWLGANHPAQLALLFGLARIGAVLLPLNFRLAFAEWQRLVADCRPAFASGAWTTPKPERSRYSPTICARRVSSSIIRSCCCIA